MDRDVEDEQCRLLLRGQLRNVAGHALDLGVPLEDLIDDLRTAAENAKRRLAVENQAPRQRANHLHLVR